MKREKIVCQCCHVTNGDLIDAIADGANDFAAVQKVTGVSTSCRRCKQDAQFVVESLLQEKAIENEKTGLAEKQLRLF